jgi:hypothetical protein
VDRFYLLVECDKVLIILLPAAGSELEVCSICTQKREKDVSKNWSI